jgi:hypothetical protein
METKMKMIVVIALAGLAAGGVGVASASQGPAERAQARAQRILDGRTAEPAGSCVHQRLLHGNQSLADGGILFGRDGDRLVYVNHPGGGCPDLGGGRFLVTRTPGARLCAGDIATVRESGGNMAVGSCALGEFTPYRRARR